tara:strand:+ start:4379 stop:4963 length:585 start_codon:yes stop_codon:yes gene_type:complete
MSSNDFDTVKKNWEKFEKYCKRLSDPHIDELLDTLGERLVMCPASPRKDQYGCYPGGLVEHAMEVTSLMRSLCDVYGTDIQLASIIKVGLLHEIGKVGDLTTPYFVDQDSDWHREKLGQLYKYSDDINKMSASHRTLFLLQHFGVILTQDEWLAIQLASGSHFEENRFYVGHEPSLAFILQQSKQAVIHKANMA